ncbi:MAG: methyl-accepting chemotaxis protein [Pseudomonadota bacterium]
MKWKDLTIGKKIAVGFGVVLVLLGIVGILNYTGVGDIVNNAKQVNEGNKLDGMLAQKEVDHLNWMSKVNALLTDDTVTTLQVETDDHQCGFGKWLFGEERKEAERHIPSLAPLFAAIEEPHHKLHASAIAIGKVFKQANTELPILLAEKEVDHLKWASRIRDVFLKGSDTLDVETDPEKCALGKWLHSDAAMKAYENGDAVFKKMWDEMITAHKHLHESAIDIQRNLTVAPETARKAFDEKTLPILDRTLNLLETLKEEARHELTGMEEAKHIFATQTAPALQTVQETLNKIRVEAKKHVITDEAMLNAAQDTKRNVTIVGIAAIVMGILLAFFIARGIVSVLQRISNQMNEGAEQVSSASGQVSSSSQSLAEGASEQAASIEETSSSLEEMSSMTKQNAENAGQADNLMKEANQVVGQANHSMNQLTTSMQEITRASEETSKIIKTIDEIAFQTNLLALNAAVEAARAGEAGAGFAVVADEVRNLAMRAAEAAKNTANLIEGTVKKVNDGSDLVTRTNEAFAQVAESAKKVGELVGEIAAASKEQAQGIEQVNKAVTEMDKVVQQNAANAEESASASEEMNAQANQMKATVEELLAMVGGTDKKNRQEALHHGYHSISHKSDQSTHPALVGKEKKKPLLSHRPKEMNPEHRIPMEEDFTDF